MKRVFSPLLLCAMCILPLFACSEPDDGHGKPTVLGEESSDLISSLIDYLESQHVDDDMLPTSFAIKIRESKEKGTQPLLVEFDPAKCYYVCGYYRGKDANDHESADSPNFAEYQWLRYEKEEDIRESYRGRTCVAAFRLNPASSVTDIRPGKKTVPAFEHFEKVAPVFEGGYNVGKSESFDRVFVYLNSTGKNRIYYTTRNVSNKHFTFRCIRLDGQIFIPVTMYRIEPTGERYDYDLKWEFGEYYDALMEIVIEGRDSYKSGETMYYNGLFTIEDFGEILR